MLTFSIYQDKMGEWRWRARTRNGRIVAESGEGYRRRDGAECGITAIFRAFNTAQVRVRPVLVAPPVGK